MGAATSSPLTARGLGTKVTGPTGDEITVFGYVSPVSNGRLFEDPREGNVYSAIDVELCAGPALRVGTVWAAPSLFQLVMPDDARIAPTVGIKQPTLQPVELLVGECVRGWVTYEQPVGRPAHVVYTGTPPYRWTV